MKVTLCRIGLVIGIIAAFFMLTGNYLPAFKEPVDLYDGETDFLSLSSSDRITAKIDFSLGQFAQEVVVEKYSKRELYEDDTYYIVPVYSGDETYWVALPVLLTKEKNIMDAITEETREYFITGESYVRGATFLEWECTTVEMSSGLYQHFSDWFRAVGYSEEEIEKYVLPVCLKHYDAAGSREECIFFFLLTLLGVGCLVVLLLDRRDKADWNKVYKADMKDSMGQYDPAQAVVIGSATFPKDYFAAVNSYVEQNDKEQAIKELQSLFKIRQKTAQAIVESWSVYYK